jgi:hypothetical protein
VVACPLSDLQMQQLTSVVNPMDNSRDPFGINVYRTTLTLIDTLENCAEVTATRTYCLSRIFNVAVAVRIFPY